jgi:hypothetical protein
MNKQITIEGREITVEWTNHTPWIWTAVIDLVSAGLVREDFDGPLYFELATVEQRQGAQIYVSDDQHKKKTQRWANTKAIGATTEAMEMCKDIILEYLGEHADENHHNGFAYIPPRDDLTMPGPMDGHPEDDKAA